MIYQRSGGRQAKLSDAEKKALLKPLTKASLSITTYLGRGWTLKKLRQWVEQKLGRSISRTALRTMLKAAGLKLEKEQESVSQSQCPAARLSMWLAFRRGMSRSLAASYDLIYVDEVHLHQDLELGYRWSIKGQDDWVASHCVPLKNRLNWYGAYDFS